MDNNFLSKKELEVVESLNIPPEYKKVLLTSKSSEEFEQKLDNIMMIGIKILTVQVNQLKALRVELIKQLALRGMTQKDLIDQLASEEKYEEADKILNADRLIEKGERTLAEMESTYKKKD